MTGLPNSEDWQKVLDLLNIQGRLAILARDDHMIIVDKYQRKLQSFELNRRHVTQADILTLGKLAPLNC